MSTNKQLVLELHRIWNEADFDAIPEVYSTSFIGHWPRGWQVDDSHGHAGVRAAIERIREAFPDWHEEILDLSECGDRIVSRYRSSGTHRGELSGLPPSGNRVEFEEISIYRVSATRVIEQWCLADDLHCMAQIQGRR